MNKQLISLLLLVAALAGAIYFLAQQSASNRQDKVALFAKLAEQNQRIERVEVSQASGMILAAVPTRTGWKTELKNGIDYPVDQQQLSALVESLTDSILFEAKTARPENYGRLGVKDVTEADSQATQVTLYTSTDQFSVLVGNSATSFQGSYVRLTGEQQSWLLDQVINVPSDGFDWLQQPILDVSTDQINMIKRTDGTPLTITSQVDTDTPFVLENKPRDKMLRYDSIVSAFVDSFVDLNFDAIVAQNKVEETQNLPAITFEMSLKSGEIINVTLRESEQLAYITFEQIMPSGAYWHALTYQISNFAAGQINKTMDDFIETQPTVTEMPSNMSIDEGESPSGS